MHRRRFLVLTASSFATGACLEFSSQPDREETPPPGTDTPEPIRPGTASPTDEGGGELVQWQAEIDKRMPRPAIEDGSVYVVGQSSGIHALDAGDGSRRWHQPSPSSPWFGPTVDDGVVYAVGHQMLVAYDAASGEARWQQTWRDGSMETAPVVGENAVFAGIRSTPTSHTSSAFPEDLWVYDNRNGSSLWNLDLGDRSNGVLSGQPILHDGTLYVLTQGGTVIALNPADGSEQWRRELDGTSETGGPALVAEQQMLVVPLETHSNEALVALGTDDGDERWRVNGIDTAPVSQGTTVYGASNADNGGESTVYAFSAADGSEQWQFSRPGGLKTWTSLSVADGTVFASFTEQTEGAGSKDDESTLYAVGRDGTEQWRFTRRCEGFSRAVVSDGTVYVAGRLGDGTLYALAPDA